MLFNKTRAASFESWPGGELLEPCHQRHDVPFTFNFLESSSRGETRTGTLELSSRFQHGSKGVEKIKII